MPLSALRSISDAIDATRARLIPPSISDWARFALVVFFLGTVGTPVPATPQVLDPQLWEVNEALLQETGIQGVVTDAATPTAWPRAVFIAVLALAVIGLGYVLIGVLMHFIVIEGLRGESLRILKQSRRHLWNALRIIGFRVGVWTVGIGALVVALGAAVGIGPAGGLEVSRGLLGAVGAVLAGVVLVDLLTRQLVIPIMIATDAGVTSSWALLLGTVRENWQEYLGYAVARPVLSGAVGVLAGLVYLVVLLAVGVVLGTLAGGVVLLGGGLEAPGTGVVVILGVLGVIFAVAAVVGFGAVNVPFQLYLWYYTLFVLGDIDARFDLIPDRRYSVRDEGPTFGVVD